MSDESTSQPSAGDAAFAAEMWARAETGATWFYWIAAITAVQTVVWQFYAALFFAGLKVTFVVDRLMSPWANEHGVTGLIIIIGAQLPFAGLLALMGWFSLRRHLWAYIVGILILLTDGLLILVAIPNNNLEVLGLLVRLVVLGLVGYGFASHLKARTLERPQSRDRGPAPLLHVPKNHPSRKDDLFNDPERLGRPK